MVSIRQPTTHPLAEYIHRLEAGEALVAESEANLVEVVGILKSYGVVLDAYWRNLIYIADHQFLVLFPFFKYFNGDVTLKRLLRHWWHDRINFEYAEYCMKTMLWHGASGLDAYLDSADFAVQVGQTIRTKIQGAWLIRGLHRLFPDFLPEQVKQLAYYSALGQFWRVMSEMFLSLSDYYDQGKITSIAQVVTHVQDGLVANANLPITYEVTIGDKIYEILPKSAGLTFLADVAVPYVEAIFFRGTPFFGTVSYNAQAYQIPTEQDRFVYGALYADPLPIGGAGIPPTLLMHDMRHFLPDYLHQIYLNQSRGEDDLLVKICQSFQKSMFCVTTATIRGLMPHPLETLDPTEQRINRLYLKQWMERLKTSCLVTVNS